MTTEILNRIAKKNKINLDIYTHVACWLNEKATYMFITFSTLEIVGGYRNFIQGKSIRMSFASLLKREENEQDYFTNGNEWISEIR